MTAQNRKQLSKEFNEYMIQTSLPTMKQGLIVTMILFVLFAATNQIFFSDEPYQQYFKRFGLILPLLVISLFFFYVKVFWSRLELILTIINILGAFLVFFVGVFADFTVEGYSYFFAWTMLVVIGNAAFYRIRFVNFVIVTALLLVGYIVASIINGTFFQLPTVFVNNLFFVIAITSVSYFVALNLFQLNRRNFIRYKVLTRNYYDLLYETKEKMRMEKNLQQSEEQNLMLLNTIPDAILVVNHDMTVLHANASLLKLHGRGGISDSPVGKNVREMYPMLSEEKVNEMIVDTLQVFETGIPSLTTQHFGMNGKEFTFETRKIPVTKNNKTEEVLVIVRDVTKDKEFESMKIKNAEQKELLLREIHHRVKNNLAIVISMLSLQTRSNPDPVLGSIIQDIELRIRSMALIHEHLYRSENLDRIPLADYLKSLSAIIASTMHRSNIKFEGDMESLEANIEAALPIGLITNELLTNAFKYAFPDNRQGQITLTLKRMGADDILLQIKDNGVGLPENFSFEDQNTLGTFMVRLLVEQLYGKMEVINNGGTTFRIIFNHRLV